MLNIQIFAHFMRVAYEIAAAEEQQFGESFPCTPYNMQVLYKA